MIRSKLKKGSASQTCENAYLLHSLLETCMFSEVSHKTRLLRQGRKGRILNAIAQDERENA